MSQFYLPKTEAEWVKDKHQHYLRDLVRRDMEPTPAVTDHVTNPPPAAFCENCGIKLQSPGARICFHCGQPQSD